ncbi:MAG: bestrophin family ion channel [Burkholderiaceae bacterium]
MRAILPQLTLMFLVGVAAWKFDGQALGGRAAGSLAIVGVTLAVFLAFRNNVSYSRYWEARQLWGELTIASRSLLSQVICYLPGEAHRADRDFVLRHLIALAHALKRQLRFEDASSDLPALTAEENADVRKKEHKAIAILHSTRRSLGALRLQGTAYVELSWMLDDSIVRLGAVIGGCERIAATPIPFAYAVLMRRTVFVYCALLPFGLVEMLRGLTPFVSVFVAYTLLALEEISNEIADPFGTSPNDLALESYCRNIERTLLELLDRPVPEALVADVNHVLR